jgi:hypothetical protein
VASTPAELPDVLPVQPPRPPSWQQSNFFAERFRVSRLFFSLVFFPGKRTFLKKFWRNFNAPDTILFKDVFTKLAIL